VTVALGIVAIILAGGSLYYARKSANSSARSAKAAETSSSSSRDAAAASQRSASVAEAADHRERAPRFEIVLKVTAPYPTDRVIYWFRLDGPQDLDEVTIYRPKPPDQIKYPVAATGVTDGWADDAVDLGPLRRTQEVRFTLCCGASEELPDFRILVEMRWGDEIWQDTVLLPSPRGVVAAK